MTVSIFTEKLFDKNPTPYNGKILDKLGVERTSSI